MATLRAFLHEGPALAILAEPLKCRDRSDSVQIVLLLFFLHLAHGETIVSPNSHAQRPKFFLKAPSAADQRAVLTLLGLVIETLRFLEDL